MTDPIFTLAETARKIGVSVETLEGWVADQIITPSAMADQKEPCFDAADLLQLEQIKHLHDIGYSSLDIRKISKKIGLPQPEAYKKKRGQSHQYLTVGELAKRSGQSARTIKYWEERGIIEPTTRSEGGHRLYDENYVLFCTLIHDLQLFGYTLEEVKETADLFRAYYAITTDTFTGMKKEQREMLDHMLEKISALFARMADLTKGMERWRKLLKEKQSQIQALKRKMDKEQTKKAQASGKKAPDPASS